MEFEPIVSHIKDELGEVIISTDETSNPMSIEISAKDVLACFNFLHTNDQLYFDMLSCISGVDNGVEAGSMEVVYNLYSIPYDHHLMIKVKLDREKAEIPSVTGIWKTADWLERETYDMYGIQFTDHPDLRRILLTADWEGFPLRKDYEHQDKYRGITVAYDIPSDDDQTEDKDRR